MTPLDLRLLALSGALKTPPRRRRLTRLWQFITKFFRNQEQAKAEK